MSVNVRGHVVRYSDEFRKVIYQINPDHVPCVYKKLLENNAINTLRHFEENQEDDKLLIKKQKDCGNVKSTWNDAGHKVTRCASADIYDKSDHSKQNDMNGWNICSKVHSATTVYCNTPNSKDTVRPRCHSAAATLNTSKNGVTSYTTQMSTKPKSDSHYTTRDSIVKTRSNIDRGVTNKGGTNQKSKGKSCERQKSTSTTSHCSTPRYISHPVSKINYNVMQFEYPENHIKQYSLRYTTRKLEELTTDNTKTDEVLDKIPPVPAPLVRLARHHHMEDIVKPTAPNSFHKGTSTISTRHEFTIKKLTDPNTSKVLEEEQQQRPETRQRKQHENQKLRRKSPYYLLCQSRDLRTESINNPLIIERLHIPQQRSHSPVVCCSRSFIPSKDDGHTNPSPANSQTSCLKSLLTLTPLY